MTLENGTGDVTHPEELVAGEFVEASPIREGEILSDGPPVDHALEDVSDDDLTPLPESDEESVRKPRTFTPKGRNTAPSGTKGTEAKDSKKVIKKESKKVIKKDNKKDGKKDGKRATT